VRRFSLVQTVTASTMIADLNWGAKVRCHMSDVEKRWARAPVPFAKNAKDRAPPRVAGASEFKGWATRLFWFQQVRAR